MGFEPVVAPVLEIVATQAALPQGGFDAVLASSAKGLEHARAAEGLRALPLHLVGATTARAAERLGWRADIVAANAAALLPLLRARYAAPARFLYLAGRDRQETLEQGLRDAGHEVVTVDVYEARAAPSLGDDARLALQNGEIAAALHYSRRSAEIFLSLARAADVSQNLASVTHLALSGEVAAPLSQAGLPARVAETPDEAGVLALLADEA